MHTPFPKTEERTKYPCLPPPAWMPKLPNNTLRQKGDQDNQRHPAAGLWLFPSFL